jgi:hypothetical protein
MASRLEPQVHIDHRNRIQNWVVHTNGIAPVHHVPEALGGDLPKLQLAGH